MSYGYRDGNPSSGLELAKQCVTNLIVEQQQKRLQHISEKLLSFKVMKP